LLENLRYHAEEEKNDPGFAKQLASLCDVYVNDAFGSAHRAHASTVGMIQFVKQAAAGLLMDKELEYLTKVTRKSGSGLVAILGGAKVSDKIEVIENLMKVVDQLLIGGAMAYTFMKAKGEPIGKSLVEDDKLGLAKDLMARAGSKLLLPKDHVVVTELKEGADSARGDRDSRWHLGSGHRAPTIEAYSAVIAKAKTIHLERTHGRLRKASVRPRHRRHRQSRSVFRCGFRGRRRRFRKSHQVGRRHGQDLPRVDGVAARPWNSWRASSCRGLRH